MIVSLDDIEIAYSDFIAQRRLADVREHRRVNVADLVRDDSEERNHIVGALGEHAFAKWLGETPPKLDALGGVCPVCWLYTGTINTFSRGGDVGRYQVRTRVAERRPLIVREKDRDDDVFVLVVCRVTTAELSSVVSSVSYEIAGWIYGADAKQYRWRRDPGGRGVAYFVPRDELRPMIFLPKEVEHVGEKAASPATA